MKITYSLLWYLKIEIEESKVLLLQRAHHLSSLVD